MVLMMNVNVKSQLRKNKTEEEKAKDRFDWMLKMYNRITRKEKEEAYQKGWEWQDIYWKGKE